LSAMTKFFCKERFSKNIKLENGEVHEYFSHSRSYFSVSSERGKSKQQEI
jgi:hypothetical protein